MRSTKQHIRVPPEFIANSFSNLILTEEERFNQMAVLHRRLLQTGANSDPLTTSSDDTYDSNAADFDNKMVIILAVLLCSLILALGLNMIARCGLRYILRVNEPELRSTPGLKKRDLRQLPEAIYKSGSKLSMIECSICLGEFVDGERVRVLPKCSHGFHLGCIDTWLKSHASCPNCRLSLHEQSNHHLVL